MPRIKKCTLHCNRKDFFTRFHTRIFCPPSSSAFSNIPAGLSLKLYFWSYDSVCTLRLLATRTRVIQLIPSHFLAILCVSAFKVETM